MSKLLVVVKEDNVSIFMGYDRLTQQPFEFEIEANPSTCTKSSQLRDILIFEVLNC